MRRSVIAALLLAATAMPIAAEEAVEPAFTPEGVRAHVEFLADDLLEGRNTGERGYDIAARYVATRFAALGLKPGTPDGWYQTVPFVETKLKPGSTAAITIDGKRFVNGEEVVFGSSATYPEQRVDAGVVFVGYGISSPANGYDDYAGLDVRGKVVAYLQGFPKGAPSEIGAHLASEKARMAEARGAIGTLTINSPGIDRMMPWDRLKHYGTEARLRWIGKDGQPHVEAPGIAVGGLLGPAATRALFAGSKVPLTSIYAAEAKKGGRPKGFALPAKLAFERQSELRKIASPNVLAVLPGSDPALAGEYVVLMAHLDHDGIDANAVGADKIMNGAMDNAAGTATMLEVARAFVQSGKRPRRSILFAAVTAEEDGLLGSEYLAHNPVTANGKVVGVVNLDMPVLTYDFVDVVAFGAEHSTLGPMVAAAVAKAGVKLSPDPMPEEGIFTRSDHYSFVTQGVPAVMLATGFGGPGEKAFGDFLKNHYHKVSDDLKLPIDWQAGAKFARINYLIARDIADAPLAPRWYAGDFFGDTFAGDAPKAAK